MNYTLIDPIISEWATKHKFAIYNQYQGEEVRSVDIVSTKGQKHQIWIDLPKGRTVAVHAWDYKKRRRDWEGPMEQLSKYLEEASQLVKSWML